MKNSVKKIKKFPKKMTQWIGTPVSLFIHTIFFLLVFLLPLFHVPFDDVLLVLTTIVSLEAIYLAIFIQMTVNRSMEDIEELSENVEEISEDVDKIQEEERQDEVVERNTKVALQNIETSVQKILRDIETLKNLH